ncbi:RNA-binding protein 39-like [Phoenix dactylifera]|uniref:RNA-binding protein 39-like n=1 Tax=Phoenix dactylifera TaxID=42345 RepID=A0A8B7BMA3_PHODC|nr:RNA-binding protein 39-like [Phoenix dactylifera]
MEFDEYDYLEKSVEPADLKKERRSSRHGGDHEKDGGGTDRPSRRSRAEEKQNGEKVDREDRDRSLRHEKDRHRSSREAERERDKDRDNRSRERDHREREKEKDKKEREKERDREKERGREEREKEEDRERRKEGERERERERERDSERRSSSRSRRHDSEVEREMERARSRERALREREIEREVRERESRRYKEKKEVVEPEVDPERDQRTVFAYQMPLKATERDVYEFFSKAGKVRDVRLIMDRNSRRSKGVGYIEFYDAMSVPMAIVLSGHLLLGQPVMVKPSEAEKNLVQSNATGAAARKIYVGNLHFNITEDQLRQVFEPFGPVELVQLPVDLETGHCKGYGFIQFAQVEHAKAAQSLNGKLEIAGRVIKVSSVTDHIGGQDGGPNAADFDDDAGGGLSLNAQSRALLMQKLDRTGTASSIAGSLGVPVLNGAVPNQQALSLPMNGQVTVPSALPALASPLAEPIGEPSECVLLKNMFDPSTETDPDFDLDIKEEVEEECSKFGSVKHIYVDKNSHGYVYLWFGSMAAAASCQHAMHMRWYARRTISATFMRPQEYEAKFRGVS